MEAPRVVVEDSPLLLRTNRGMLLAANEFFCIRMSRSGNGKPIAAD